MKPAHGLPLAAGALALALALLAGASVALVWATLDAAERNAVAGVLVTNCADGLATPARMRSRMLSSAWATSWRSNTA